MAKWSRERIIREILRREALGLTLDLGGAGPVQSLLQTAALPVSGSWRKALMAAGTSPEKARAHDPRPPSRILASIKAPPRRKQRLRPGELKRGCHPLVAAAPRLIMLWAKSPLGLA